MIVDSSISCSHQVRDAMKDYVRKRCVEEGADVSYDDVLREFLASVGQPIPK